MTLPNRRECITQNVVWNDKRYHITVGFDPRDGEDAEPKEVWSYGAKIGSDQHSLLVDLCRDLSLQLQDGRPAQDIAARVQRDEKGKPVTIYGMIADELMSHV